jgi:recombination protein RecT
MAKNPTSVATATGANHPTSPAEITEAPSFAIVRTYWPQLKRLLPAGVNPDAWYASVFSALFRGQNPTKNIDLWRCANGNPESLLFALFDAARLGLEPGTEHYYLTPRPNSRATNGVEVLGITGYQGEIELIYRGGAVSAVICDVVREHDDYDYDPSIHPRPVHRIKGDRGKFTRKADRGELIGVYAYGVMLDGGGISKVVELNEDDIERAKRASGTAKYGTTFWNDPDDEVAMWLKTSIHRLQKWVPTSAENRRAVANIAAHAQVQAVNAVNAPAAASLPDAIAAAQQAALPGGQPGHAPSPIAAPPEQAPEPPLDPTPFAQPPAPEDDDRTAEYQEVMADEAKGGKP